MSYMQYVIKILSKLSAKIKKKYFSTLGVLAGVWKTMKKNQKEIEGTVLLVYTLNMTLSEKITITFHTSPFPLTLGTGREETVTGVIALLQ